MKLETVCLNPLIRRCVGRKISNRMLRHFANGISPRASVAYSARLINKLENITIGEGSIVGFQCELHAWGSIDIGKNVIISPQTVILTGSHDIYSQEYGELIKPVSIDDYAWIAYRCIILPGVRIGRGAVVAAGSVVTKHVEPWSVVAGNPARHVKWRPERDLTYVPAAW